VASVDITNTGTEAVDGWTLAFSFRRPWQSFGGGWNGNWTADGASVTATNVDWNASIAPGASVNVGFVGNYGGPNLLPNLFTLNGTLCTTVTPGCRCDRHNAGMSNDVDAHAAERAELLAPVVQAVRGGRGRRPVGRVHQGRFGPPVRAILVRRRRTGRGTRP
jgi:hypothetical protein